LLVVCPFCKLYKLVVGINGWKFLQQRYKEKRSRKISSGILPNFLKRVWQDAATFPTIPLQFLAVKFIIFYPKIDYYEL